MVRKHSLCGVEAPLHRREFMPKTENPAKTWGKPSTIVQLGPNALKLPLYICIQRQMLYLALIGLCIELQWMQTHRQVGVKNKWQLSVRPSAGHLWQPSKAQRMWRKRDWEEGKSREDCEMLPLRHAQPLLWRSQSSHGCWPCICMRSDLSTANHGSGRNSQVHTLPWWTTGY